MTGPAPGHKRTGTDGNPQHPRYAETTALHYGGHLVQMDDKRLTKRCEFDPYLFTLRPHLQLTHRPDQPLANPSHRDWGTSAWSTNLHSLHSPPLSTLPSQTHSPHGSIRSHAYPRERIDRSLETPSASCTSNMPSSPTTISSTTLSTFCAPTMPSTTRPTSAAPRSPKPTLTSPTFPVHAVRGHSPHTSA
ncbi:hypothetical protein SprV_0802528800 [Sparganum proliferum]